MTTTAITHASWCRYHADGPDWCQTGRIAIDEVPGAGVRAVQTAGSDYRSVYIDVPTTDALPYIHLSTETATWLAAAIRQNAEDLAASLEETVRRVG